MIVFLLESNIKLEKERMYMGRKRLTQILPFLLPLRIWQKNLFYRIGMKFDGNEYAKTFGEKLDYEIKSGKLDKQLSIDLFLLDLYDF